MLKFGVTAQKVLLLLLGGAVLGLTISPRGQRRIVKAVQREWKALNREELYRSIRRLYESKLVKFVVKDNGVAEMVLTRDGHQVALSYKIDEMKIKKPERWDKRWRMVIFDIPEKQKQLRDTLRSKLKQLGLVEFQKSVFVHPYECRNEVDFVIELYDARRYVRYVEAFYIDNELHLKRKFQLI